MKECGDDDVVSSWPFHRLEPWQFEQLAATVLESKFAIHLLTFSEGRDGGRDAVARGVSIRLGRSKTLQRQNIVVQVKHTKRPSCLLDDGIRNLLFKPELKKVKKLVSKDELDIYIAVTNYRLPAGQEEKIVGSFKAVGCKNVIVVGRESLKRWIKQSRELMRNVANLYNIGGPGMRQLAAHASGGIQKVKKSLRVMVTRLDKTDETLQKLSRQQTVSVTELQNANLLLTEVKDTVVDHGERAPPLRSLSRGVERSNERLREMSHIVQSNRQTLDGLRRRIDYQGAGSTHLLPSSVQGMATRKGPIHKPDREVSDSALLTLTGHAGVLREWRFVVRRLGLKEADVLEVATSSGSLREQAYQALVTWRERNGNAGSGHALIKALKDCNLHAPAVELEANFLSEKETG